MSEKPGNPPTNNSNNVLTKEDFRIMQSVRMDMWKSAFMGFCTGSAAGVGVHLLGSVGNRYKIWKVPPLSKNTAFASMMIGGSIGSYLMTYVTGKNEMHNIHSINDRARRKEQIRLYEQELQDATALENECIKRQQELQLDERDDGTTLERIQRDKNRLYRRVSIGRSIDEGHGISDAHGGHWVNGTK